LNGHSFGAKAKRFVILRPAFWAEESLREILRFAQDDSIGEILRAQELAN
jgi:hypothetical protein